jgi:hypothetical protein
MNTKQLQQEILDWDKANKNPYDKWQEPTANFFGRAESHGDVVLPSGTVEYVDIERDGDEALAVFTVDGVLFALAGYYSSWGSDWDNGLFRVEKRTVTIERYEKLEEVEEPDAPTASETQQFFSAVLNPAKSPSDEIREALEAVKAEKVERDSNGRRIG